MLVTEQFC